MHFLLDAPTYIMYKENTVVFGIRLPMITINDQSKKKKEQLLYIVNFMIKSHKSYYLLSVLMKNSTCNNVFISIYLCIS